MDKVTTTKKSSTRKPRAPVAIDGPHFSKKSFFKQGTTWAGILSIGAALATGGVSALTDPVLLQAIGAGIGLLVAEN